MPPALILALGTAGALAVARLLVRESRRVNRILDPHRADPQGDGREAAGVVKLERDPATGAYRPRPRGAD